MGISDDPGRVKTSTHEQGVKLMTDALEDHRVRCDDKRHIKEAK